MPAVLDRLPRGATVLAIRLRSLGDCVLSTPAFDLLKRHRPDLHLAVAVEDRFRAIYDGNPDIDSLVGPGRVPHAALALNLHGGPRSTWLTLASMARLRAGFGHYRFGPVYNVKIPRAQEILHVDRTVHTAEHVASAMFFLGVPQAEIPRAKLIAPGPPPLDPPYAVLHPFASAAGKTWAPERFAEVARTLPVPAAIVAGPGDDTAPFAAFRVFQSRPLGEVKSLIAGAALFIGNDSGPAHIAAAFGVPVVALFGASSIPVWRPWRTRAEVLSDPAGLAAISVTQVLAAAERLR